MKILLFRWFCSGHCDRIMKGWYRAMIKPLFVFCRAQQNPQRAWSPGADHRGRTSSFRFASICFSFGCFVQMNKKIMKLRHIKNLSLQSVSQRSRACNTIVAAFTPAEEVKQNDLPLIWTSQCVVGTSRWCQPLSPQSLGGHRCCQLCN